MSAAAPTGTLHPQQSRLEIRRVQAGRNSGSSTSSAADIEFAPDALANSRFDVLIDMKSVDSMTRMRHDIRGSDISMWRTAYGALRHPQLHRTAAGYAASAP